MQAEPPLIHAIADRILSHININPRNALAIQPIATISDFPREYTKLHVKDATAYLRRNKYVIEQGVALVLDVRGHDAIEAGGLLAYLQDIKDKADLDADAKRATVSNSIWNKKSVKINTVLTIITIGLAGYTALKSNTTDKAIKDVDLNLARSESLLQRTDSLIQRSTSLLHDISITIDSLRVIQSEANASAVHKDAGQPRPARKVKVPNKG